MVGLKTTLLLKIHPKKQFLQLSTYPPMSKEHG